MPSSPPGGGGITPLCAAGGALRCSSSVPGGPSPCGMAFSTVPSVPPREAALAVSGAKQEARKIRAATVVQLVAHVEHILIHRYLKHSCRRRLFIRHCCCWSLL